MADIALAIIIMAALGIAVLAVVIILREVMPRAQDRTGHLAEKIPYRSLIGESLVVLDEGRLLTAWEVSGTDYHSLTYRVQATASAEAARAFADADEAVEVRFRVFRRGVTGYPKPQQRPRDPLSSIIYDLQVQQFSKQGVQYESKVYLALSWSPPKGVLEKIANAAQNTTDEDPFIQAVGEYEKKVDEFADSMGDRFGLRRLDAAELLSFLHRCATGEDLTIEVPETEVVSGLFVRPYDLTGIIADQDILPDFVPRVGDTYFEVISVEQLRKGGTSPAALNRILNLKMPLDVDVRAIKLSPEQLARSAKSAWNKQRGQSDPREGGMKNLPAERRAKQAQNVDPYTDSYYHWNVKVIVAGENRARLRKAANFIRGQLARAHFGSRIERLGNPDAFVSTLPGVVNSDLTESLIDATTAADLAPLSKVYQGPKEHPHPRRKGQPALVRCLGIGNAPVDVYDSVEDLAFSGLIGPPGSGKSTFLALLTAADRMMHNDIDDFVYDQGRSMERYVRGARGNVFTGDIANPRGGLNPFDGIENERRRARVELWLRTLFAMRNFDLTEKREEILHNLLINFAKSRRRSMTLFCALLETIDRDMALALSFWTVKGGAGYLFDSEVDGLAEADLQMYEMGTLLRYKDEKLTAPFILLTWDRILERSEATGRMVRVNLDEAHEYFKHPIFAPVLGSYYNQARKLDGGIRMSTQEPQHFLSSVIAPTILNDTKTWFFLPNTLVGEAESDSSDSQRELYKQKFVGVTDEICNMIAAARPKRNVVLFQDGKASVLNPNLSDEALTILGSSSKDDRDELDDVLRAGVSDVELPAELWKRRAHKESREGRSGERFHEIAERYRERAAEYGLMSTESAA